MKRYPIVLDLAVAQPTLSQLQFDESGNILPMAAAGILVMAALIGSGVDMSRAYQVQTRLQSACDASVLAGRRAVTINGFDATARAQATRYFDVNFDEGQQGSKATSITFDADQTGNAISARAETVLPMLMMQLFGMADMQLSADCSSTMGVGNSDVTMVLDVTGSMSTSLSGGTRLSALKSAMINFYDTVEMSTAGSNARIRYAFVPYSTTVNVGRLLVDLDPDYLVDTWTIQSRRPVFNTITEQVRVGWDAPVISSSTNYGSVTTSNTASLNNSQYTSQGSCTAALPNNTAWADSGAPSSSSGTTTNDAGQQVVTNTTQQPQKMTTYLCQKQGQRWRQYYYDSQRIFFTYQYATSNPIMETRTRQVFSNWQYQPVQYDVSDFKRFNPVSTPTGNNGADQTSKWEGCIEERATVPEPTFSFSNLGGISPSDALDLDIDMTPDGDDATKWAPLWPEVAYLRNSPAISTSGSKATSYCVTPARALDELDRSTFTAYANSLSAQGNTYLDIGLLWGARLSSPDGIFGDLVRSDPANGANVNRHIIFMTDGFQEGRSTTYQAYGIERLDRRVTSDGSTTQEDLRHSQRFRAICDAIKAKGIRLWVIGFANTLNSDLSYCGSPGSSFTASNATQLNAAFQEIAKQVGELRVMQ